MSSAEKIKRQLQYTLSSPQAQGIENLLLNPSKDLLPAIQQRIAENIKPQLEVHHYAPFEQDLSSSFFIIGQMLKRYEDAFVSTKEQAQFQHRQSLEKIKALEQQISTQITKNTLNQARIEYLQNEEQYLNKYINVFNQIYELLLQEYAAYKNETEYRLIIYQVPQQEQQVQTQHDNEQSAHSLNLRGGSSLNLFNELQAAQPNNWPTIRSITPFPDSPISNFHMEEIRDNG